VKVLAPIYGDESRWQGLSDDEREEVYSRHRAFAAVAGAKLVGGAELAPTQAATTVRVRGGELLITDGPFAETKEQLGGFYVLSCEDLDEATELASQIPSSTGGPVELRVAHEEEEAA
jgi:hypothetical protein